MQRFLNFHLSVYPTALNEQNPVYLFRKTMILLRVKMVRGWLSAIELGRSPMKVNAVRQIARADRVCATYAMGTMLKL